jgi:hypothetical protein
MTEAELDACFAEMSNDAEYQVDAIALAAEFGRGDWEAFRCSENMDFQTDRIQRSEDQKARHQ